MRWRLSSAAEAAERFLGRAALDRAPWLTAAVLAGIAAWFGTSGRDQWLLLLALAAIVSLAALSVWRGREDRANLLLAAVGLSFAFALGVGLIWARSEMVGAEPLERPVFAEFDGRVLERIEQPAQDRVRLVLATRHPDSGEAIKVRVNVEPEGLPDGVGEGSTVRLRARLMPPAPPMLPGAYNFARTAWFDGLAATGSAVGEVELLASAGDGDATAQLQRRLSAHVRGEVTGSAGAIAAAFASGDRGAISAADEDAMRDSGLTHLLSISGLHVSAVIAATYVLAIRLLALFPWLALRMRLPIAGAAVGALAGLGYTLLTGAEVPTVRSCIAALLVLGALVIGREALSMRMVAVAAMVVMLLWPESVVGPSFQMSFAAVLAIVALSGSAPVKRFLAPREESFGRRVARGAAMLFLTGIVIEVTLMPIGLYHFHKAGVYGAFANLVAIPLTTFVSMPLIALGLLLDTVGAGAPAWWLVGKSLDALLWIAHWTAAQPGAVKRLPQMSEMTFALFVLGGLWLALWKGRARLLGLLPAGIALLATLTNPGPDLLVSADGRHLAVIEDGEDAGLFLLRDTQSSYTRDNLLELASAGDETRTIDSWNRARCSADFCSFTLRRDGRDWNVLAARSGEVVEERALAAACERADIVVADRFLPRSCEPRWLTADRRHLSESGGLAIYLEQERVVSVADSQGAHGWWRGAQRR